MDALPTELVELILARCDFNSLKNLRLVTRATNAVATPLVFEHFYTAYSSRHLEKLCRLAKSHLAKHVKCFTFFSDFLPSWSKAEWKDHIDYRPEYQSWAAVRKAEVERDCTSENCLYFEEMNGGCLNHSSNFGAEYELLPRHHFSKEELAPAWKAYSALNHEQCEWREDREGLVFQEHFAMLPNVYSASVKCATPFQGRTNEWPVWKTLRPTILVGLDDWMYQRAADERESEVTAPLAEGQAALCLLEAIGFRSQFSGAHHIAKLETVQTHTHQYMDLIGNTTGHGGFNRGDLSHLSIPAHKSRYLKVQETFRHLMDLKICLPDTGSSLHAIKRVKAMLVANELHRFLPTARQLRRLELVYTENEEAELDGNYRPERGHRHQLTLLFREPQDGSNEPLWPHLEHLSLSTNVDAHFKQFLQCHSRTLRSLELKDMIIVDMQSLLESIPTTLPLLEHVYLECIWAIGNDRESDSPYSCFFALGTDVDEAYERQAKAYLLKECDELPELKANYEESFGASDISISEGPHITEADEELLNLYEI